MQGYVVNYGPKQIVCREGDPSSELYYLLSGKLLICLQQGSEIKALSRIGPGEFVGELSSTTYRGPLIS
jgi:CRP-like cAMP-binding protein